jgi:hypothetical protein
MKIFQARLIGESPGKGKIEWYFKITLYQGDNMRKALVILATIVAAGSTAAAGSINFDFRTDMEGFSANEDSGKPSYHRYYLQTARLDMKNKIGDTTSLRARFRLNKDQGVVNKRDSANTTVDYFMVKTELMPGLNLGAGKFQGMAGGWENLVSGSDVYFKSTALAELGKSTAMDYYTGASLEYKLAEGHNLNLHLANADTDDLDGTSLKQTRQVASLGWDGSYSEGNIKPMITYTTSPEVGTDKSNTFMSAGVKMKFDNILADVEYLSNTWAATTAGEDDDVTTSMTASLAMKGEFWTPRAKIESSVVNDNGKKKSGVTGLGLIAEYKPVAETDFRYHVAVVNYDTKTESTGKTASTQTVLAGIKLNADILK